MYAYSSQAPGGIGDFLGGTLGSSKKGTNIISNNYEGVGFVKNGIDGMSKEHLLRYLKSYSDMHSAEIVSLKNFNEIPIVLQALVKNATFYGLQFKDNSNNNNFSLNISAASEIKINRNWTYTPTTPSKPCITSDFEFIRRLPNEKAPVDREVGSIAIKATPKQGAQTQTLIHMYGDSNNNVSIDYTPSGSFQYRMTKDGMPFALMEITPPPGKNFNDKEVVLTLESIKYDQRKYGLQFKEDANVFHVSCPNIAFDEAVQQPILWNWKHTEGSITPADSANARGFSYLTFSAFVPQMKKISVGGINAACDLPFEGSIYQVQISRKLPIGSSDFWNDTKKEIAPIIEERKQRKRYFSASTTPIYKKKCVPKKNIRKINKKNSPN